MKTKPTSQAERYASIFPTAALALGFYLEYCNHYLTAECIADHHGISEQLAIALINEGRAIHKLNDQ